MCIPRSDFYIITLSLILIKPRCWIFVENSSMRRVEYNSTIIPDRVRGFVFTVFPRQTSWLISKMTEHIQLSCSFLYITMFDKLLPCNGFNARAMHDIWDYNEHSKYAKFKKPNNPACISMIFKLKLDSQFTKRDILN